MEEEVQRDDHPPESTLDSDTLTPRGLRSRLRTRLLSSVPEKEVPDVLSVLETICAKLTIDVAPAGAWFGRDKDTLLVQLDHEILGALVIQKLPFLDPLLLKPGIRLPALVLEFLRLRAEGILQGTGADEYRIAIMRQLMPAWHRYLTKDPGSVRTHDDGLVILRRTL